MVHRAADTQGSTRCIPKSCTHSDSAPGSMHYAYALCTSPEYSPPMTQIEDIVAGYRVLAEHGIIDAYGHISLRHESDPNRYLLARSVAPEIVTADDIIEYDLDSNPLNANGRDSVKERFIHGEVYKARPDVMAVVHNHSPTVVPFSVTGVPMRPLFHMASFVGYGVPVYEIRDHKQGSDLLVRS